MTTQSRQIYHKNINPFKTVQSKKSFRPSPSLKSLSLRVRLGLLFFFVTLRVLINLNGSHQSIGEYQPSGYDEDEGKHEICFVTSVFAKDVGLADRIGNATELSTANPSFRYLAFTNLEELETPGWQKIVKKDLPYKRLITHSRWGKFVPWKDRTASKCHVIFYLDGYTMPRANATHLFRKEAKRIRESKYGLGLYVHPTLSKYKKLIWSVVRYKKDSKKNVKTTMRFLRQQPDFQEKNTTVYINRHLGFDPSNPYYQNMSDFFWNLYSQEIGSWRDQFLWAYAIKMFQVKPLEMTDMDILFEADTSRMGNNGHKYVK